MGIQYGGGTGGGGGGSVLPTTSVNKQFGNYTLALPEQTVEFINGASDFDCTLPDFATVAFPTGRIIMARKTGSGVLSFRKGGTSTTRGFFGNVEYKLTLADGAIVYLEVVAPGVWLIAGPVEAI